MTDPVSGSISIIGLGPGDPDLLTRRAWQLLETADALYLRTSRHPAVRELPAHIQWTSFDDIYDNATNFEDVYLHISSEIVSRARHGVDVIYAVPGDPTVGEATVTMIASAAEEAGLPTILVPGISFVEPTLAAVGVDALNGLQVFDAIAVARYNHPPVNSDYPLLLGQVYSRLMANELKLALMAVYPDEHRVTLVHGAGTATQYVESLFLYEIDRSEHIDHLTALYVPPLPIPSSLSALAEAVAVLRSPDGCPWDREQTSQSLRSDFLEEVSEVLEAIDGADPVAVQEELGDVLFHIVMQVQMAREEEQFRLSDVIATIYAKLRRRHPHVWGDWEVEDSDEVVANWEAIKKQEKEESEATSLLDNVSPTIAALSRAQKVQERVRKVGFDWPDVSGVIEKLHEEIAELKGTEDPQEQAAEMGDVLFALVNWARWLGLDAELVLRDANSRFEQRFRLLERLARERSIDLENADLDTLEALWQEAKRHLDQERNY